MFNEIFGRYEGMEINGEEEFINAAKDAIEYGMTNEELQGKFMTFAENLGQGILDSIYNSLPDVATQASPFIDNMIDILSVGGVSGLVLIVLIGALFG